MKTAVIFKYFNSYLSVISLSGYNYLTVIMSVSTEEDAINAMLLQFGGEDVELVLDELRKCHHVAKVLREKQCIDSIFLC